MVVILAIGLGACGSGVLGVGASGAASGERVTINDAHPGYRGIYLGTPMSEVLRRFGKPPPNKSPYTGPVGEDPDELGLPAIGPDPPRRPPIRGNLPRNDIHDLRYRSVVFSVSTTPAGTYYFAVSAPGARTSRGVGIGDSLSKARGAYRGALHCDIANQGSEYPSFPYCGARLAPHVYLYFGQDPIRSIAFASTWLPPGG
jgi:hypothetical protein